MFVMMALLGFMTELLETFMSDSLAWWPLRKIEVCTDGIVWVYNWITGDIYNLIEVLEVLAIVLQGWVIASVLGVRSMEMSIK